MGRHVSAGYDMPTTRGSQRCLFFNSLCLNLYDGILQSHSLWNPYFHESLGNPATAEIKVHPHEALPQGLSPHCGEGLAQLVSHFGDRILNDAD